jgi:hypothetical protein
MPGDVSSSEDLYSGHQALHYTALTFRDAAGIHWARWPDGFLLEVAEGPGSAAQLDTIRQVNEVMTRDDHERREAAGYPRASGSRRSRAFHAFRSGRHAHEGSRSNT